MSCDTELQALHTQHIKYTTNLKSFFQKEEIMKKKLNPHNHIILHICRSRSLSIEELMTFKTIKLKK